MEQEKTTLQEKQATLIGELTQAGVEYERLKRESQAQAEQDRGTIGSLHSELHKFRGQFEEAT